MKILGSIVCLLLLALFANTVSAQAGYEFTDIDINGIQALDANPTIHVERGDKVHVRVELEGTNDVDSVRVRAWISGAENGRIEGESNLFRVEPGITFFKSVNLQIPEDLDASKTYTLHVEVSDEDNDIEEKFVLDVEEKRHQINIFKALFNPGLTVNQGDFLSIGVIIENFGDYRKGEKNIVVEASIPELGLVIADSIDELSTEEAADDDSDKESTAKLDLPPIDLDVPAGEYDLTLRAYFNRGRDFTEKKYTLVVEGNAVQTQENLIINAGAQKQDLIVATSTSYSIRVANLGNEIKTLTAEVAGADGFATTQITPQVLTLPAGATGEFLVSLSARADATQGENIFTVKVNEGLETVGEVNLVGNVVIVQDTLQNVKKGLQIGFVILLVILVILGLIIGISKMGKQEDEESQTYY